MTEETNQPQQDPCLPHGDHHYNGANYASAHAQAQAHHQQRRLPHGWSLPPANYMANIIASRLLPLGPSMFGNRSTANCILCVGPQRFYVHVQMLASRSPTFRKIFDEMIMHQVWESESGSLSVNDQEDEDSDDMSEYEQEHRPVHVQGRPPVNGLDDDDDDANDADDDGQDSDDDEHMMDEDFMSSSSPSRRPFDCNFQVQQSQQHQNMDMDQTCIPQAERPYNPSLPIIANEIKATWHLSADLGQNPQDDSDNDQSDCEEQQQHFHGDDSNLEEGLPELKISLTDPVGSRFEELLYWIYTDNGPRWLASFTPQNYDSILANILKLNIITPDVLEICRMFEASTSPDLGLYGRAESALAFSLDPLSESMAASAAGAAAAAVAGSAIHV